MKSLTLLLLALASIVFCSDTATSDVALEPRDDDKWSCELKLLNVTCDAFWANKPYVPYWSWSGITQQTKSSASYHNNLTVISSDCLPGSYTPPDGTQEAYVLWNDGCTWPSKSEKEKGAKWHYNILMAWEEPGCPADKDWKYISLDKMPAGKGQWNCWTPFKAGRHVGSMAFALKKGVLGA
jgi:hypothetical protein